MRRDFLERLSLQWKLPLLLGALLLLVIGALCGAAYLEVRKSTEHSAELRLREVNGQLVDLLRTQAAQLEARAAAIASAPEIAAYLRAPDPRQDSALTAHLTPATLADTQVVAIQLIYPDGTPVYAAGRLASFVATVDRQVGLPGEGEARDSTAVGRFLARGDTILFPTEARVSVHGQDLGHLVIWRRNSNNPKARTGIASLIGAGARFYIGSPGGTWMDESGVAPSPSITGTAPSDRDRLLRYHRAGDGEVLGLVSVVPGTPWQLVLEFSADEIHAPANRFLRRILLIGVLLAGLGLAGGWVVSRHITQPLLRLTAATAAFGHGQHGTRVEKTAGGELGTLADAFNRMAEAVDAEAEAREASEAQWRLLFDQNPRPMWVTDQLTGRFLAVNDSATELYGLTRTEFLGRTVRDLRTPDSAEGSLGREMGLTPFERHRIGAQGTIEVEITRHALLFGGTPAELAVVQNITARKLKEAQNRQAQKMEAVGRLAGGVAHDFNNLLAVIAPYAELLYDEAPPGSRQAADLEHIIAAAQRGTALTRQLLTFSRQRVMQVSTLGTNEAVKGVEELLRRLLGEDVELVTRLEAGPVHIRIDPGQFEQILINLAVNARDAMPTGGQLIITTAEWSIDPESLSFHSLHDPGRYVVITVTDTGVGMDAATCSRVFEPFFTTKAPGRGTGIGLATVYGIVTQSGGQITVYSEPGVGTTFRLYFPIVSAEGGRVTQAPRSTSELRGSETILLVEDDPAVRDAAVEVLQRSGYTVLVATDPEDAQALADRHRRTIDLVMSDVVMPRMSGPTLLASLRKYRPDLKVLLISGYAGESLSARGELSDDIPFLEKPFTVSGLLTKVREVLDGVKA